MSWQTFCEMYRDDAMKCAKFHLAQIKKASTNWDSRINEDDACENVAVDVLQNTYETYDSAKGCSIKTYISRLSHNAMINEIHAAQKLLTCDTTASDEAKYSDEGSRIPETVLAELRDKIHDAILKLPAIDQAILGIYVTESKNFMDKCVEELGIPANVVSVRKSRAFAKLPELMDLTEEDYYDKYVEPFEDMGLQFIQVKSPEPSPAPYINPIYPAFDIDATALGFFNMFKKVCHLD